MPTMTNEQRQQVLRFVREHSPDGRPAYLDKLNLPQKMFGLDLGWAIVHLACEELCGMEDPDIFWSTAKGRDAVR